MKRSFKKFGDFKDFGDPKGFDFWRNYEKSKKQISNLSRILVFFHQSRNEIEKSRISTRNLLEKSRLVKSLMVLNDCMYRDLFEDLPFEVNNLFEKQVVESINIFR